MNFDGYRDLVLCTARGAANEYSVFCLWDPVAGRFGEIVPQDAFDLETERASGQTTPLELVNHSLQRRDAGFGYIISREQDGAANFTQLVYSWEGNGRVPTLIHVHDLSSVTGSLVRDRAFIFFSQGDKVWDHVYPAEWYYGATEPFRAFGAAADSLIKNVKEENYEQAYKVLSKTTVLESVCGRICPHMSQCRGKCVRGIKSEPVQIGELEAFIGDMAVKNNYEMDDGITKKINKKVAVIGSGPAGLTCSAFLARNGFSVTIFEKMDKLGGLLRHG
ncbi:MAG: NAD(P)-binding protein, partial [Clostridia bacterium]|nr:NAD(P)-binding protein [Clostridia bacterium]